jgi:hypothetical protein
MAHCTIHKNWILGGYSAEYSHTLEVNGSGLSDLIDQLIRALHDYLGVQGVRASLRDFKGRNRGDKLLSEIPGEGEDELFRVGGSIATDPAGDDFEWSPFDLTCRAVFSAFEGTHHIRHSTDLQRSDSLPPWLPWELIGAAAPIRPSYCRVGLERFQSRFTLSSIGFMPQVTDSFLLDATGGTAQVRIITEQRSRKPCNPTEEIPAFGALATALQKALGFDLKESFRDSLAKGAAFGGHR